MQPWTITVATPSFYSVGVIEAYGVNEKEDWTALVHNFTQLSWRNGLENAQKWIPEYDGFGMPLNPLVNITSRQIGSGTNVLPDSIYIYWVSYIHQPKFYVTQYDVSEKVRRFIKTRRSYMSRDGTKQFCYKNKFVFGLQPNGHAKVWLDGCATYTYVTEIPPKLTPDKDSSGFGPERYAGGDASLKKRAQKAGVTTPIDPIPWGKVNKVYWNHKADKVDSIEDYMPKTGQ